MPQIEMRRVAKLHINMGTIASLLHLPDGVTPVYMFGTSDPSGVYVVVQSDDFPEVPPGAEAPSLPYAVYAETVTVEGKRFVREFTTAKTAKELADRLPAYATEAAK